MLSSVELHRVDGTQSFTVDVLATPEVMPMYWLRLFCVPFVSVQFV